jgi:hypothetical protein
MGAPAPANAVDFRTPYSHSYTAFFMPLNTANEKFMLGYDYVKLAFFNGYFVAKYLERLFNLYGLASFG